MYKYFRVEEIDHQSNNATRTKRAVLLTANSKHFAS
jgi:hypothetical protein